MQHCAEERRKLAAEWTRFHTQEKMRQERVEKEASRALERDAQREGSIINMAQVITHTNTLYYSTTDLTLLLKQNKDKIFKQ